MSAAFRPPGSGLAADPGRGAADKLDTPSVACCGPVWSAACRARSAGVGMGGMCVRSMRGFLERRRGSAADDVCWAGWLLGPPWPLSVPSWMTTPRAAGGGVQLRRRDQSGFCVSWCQSGVPPCISGV